MPAFGDEARWQASGAGDASSAKEGSRQVKRKTEDGDAALNDVTVKQLAHCVSVLGKLVLQNTQDIKALKALCFRNFLVPEGSDIAKACVEANKTYRTQNEGVKGHGLGSPDFAVWRSILGLMEVHDGKDAKDAPLMLLRDHKPKCHPQGLTRLVFHVRIAKAGKTTTKGIEIGVHSSLEGIVDGIYSFVCKEQKGSECEGKQPKGDFERRLIKIINETLGNGRVQ